MADKVQLSDKKIHFSIGGDEYSGNAIEVNGKEVGGIAYDEENNEIQGIKINPQYRRKGIAKYAIKKLFENNPKIDNVYVRATPDAKKFWQSVGVEFVAGSYNEDAGLWEGNLKRKIVISMAKGGFLGKGEMFWKKLTSSKKMEFLYDNFTPEITPRSQELLVGKAYNFLPKNVKIKFEAKYANVEEYGVAMQEGGSMATGGGVYKGGGVGKMYYHIIEYGDYGNVGYQGYYDTIEEAQKQVEKLSDYFPNQTFQIFADKSRKEPPITTMASGGKIGGGKGSEWAFWAGLLGWGILSYIGVNKK